MGKEKPTRLESQPWQPLPYMELAVQHLVERSHAGLLLKPG
jgi:hypothetical protein